MQYLSKLLQYQNNMVETILSLLLILFAYGAYKIWLKPYKLMKRYGKSIQNLGYKVYVKPYNPFENQLMDTIRKGIKEGDALKIHKEIYSQYDVIVSNVLTQPKIIFIHPDFVKDFYSVDKHYQYPKKKKIVSVFSRAAGYGLPFSQGKNWKRKRNIFNNIFNFDFLKSQTGKISQACSDAIQHIQKKSKINQKQSSVTYNILDLTVTMFSGVMMASFLGGKKEETIDGILAGQFLRSLISDLTLISFKPLNFILGPKILSLGITKQHRQLQQRIKIYRNWGHQFIRNRVKQIKQNLQKNPDKLYPDDIIQALVMDAKKHKKSEKHDEEIITNQEEIFQEFNAFFFAGTDTTSNFTQMMIYQIARHPQIEQKVREEVSKFMPNDDFSFQNLKKFKYIQLLQKQTTRCHGPGTFLFQRTASVDNYINGLLIKKGTGVSVLSYCNHFSKKYFKDPLQFRPERWEGQCDNMPSFVVGGFSAGARTCIGKHLAMLESKIAIIKFIKRYKKITLPNNNFKMTFKFLYGPEDFESGMIINSQ